MTNTIVNTLEIPWLVNSQTIVEKEGMNNFKDLRIWQDACDIIVEVYKLIDQFPKEEKYGLSSQLGRSINSIGANIAESCGRFHFKDRTNFLFNARGSLYESEHHLNIAFRLSYISEDQLQKVSLKLKDLNVRLNNYINSTKVTA